MNNIVMFIGIFVAVIGLIFAIMPHELHNKIVGILTFSDASGTEEYGTHETHQIYGAIVALAGMAIAFAGTKLK